MSRCPSLSAPMPLVTFVGVILFSGGARATEPVEGNGLAGLLQERGFTASVSHRLAQGDPVLAGKICEGRLCAGSFYRGMMIPLSLYSPLKGAQYCSGNQEVAMGYARGGDFLEKYRGQYRHLLFELQFPRELLHSAGKAHRLALAHSFPVVDERYFISRVGLLKSGTREVRWYSFEDAFDRQGKLRADLVPPP